MTKRWNFAYTFAILIMLIVLLSGAFAFPVLKQTSTQVIPYVPHLNRDTSPGIMNPFHWSALKWLSESSAKDSKVYFFYGDLYDQDALLRNSKRFHYQVTPEDFIRAIQDRKVKRHYISELPGDSGGSIKVRTGFLSFERPIMDRNDSQDICNFDYLIFDKISRQEVLAQYNLLIASELLNKDYINPVFENEVVIILKNDNIGADCIEERSF